LLKETKRAEEEVEHSYGKKADWRELCRQATEEKDQNRMIEIIHQLVEA